MRQTSTGLSEFDVTFMDTRSTLTQIIRAMPTLLDPPFSCQNGFSGQIDMDHLFSGIQSRCSTESSIAKRMAQINANLQLLINKAGGSSEKEAEIKTNLGKAVSAELASLPAVKKKMAKEITSLQVVLQTIVDHTDYLRSQLDSYKTYLKNVRTQARKTETHRIGGAHDYPPPPNQQPEESRTSVKKDKKAAGPIKFSFSQLEKDGVIVDSNVPDNRSFLFLATTRSNY